MAKRNIITLALAAVCVLGLAAMASAGIPNTDNSFASADNCGRFTIAPGGGETLIESANDYTIHVTVNDINNDPVTTLIATDLWLDRTGDLVACANHSQADAGTDGSGYTTFTGTIFGGLAGDASNGVDCNSTDLYVYALGIPLNGNAPVCVSFDSPDLNGDLAVSVADFGKFAFDFNCVSGCDPCHDYNEDGVSSVADFAIFSAYFNASVCP